MLPIVVARSFSGKVAQSQGDGAILAVLFTIGNAFYPPVIFVCGPS